MSIAYVECFRRKNQGQAKVRQARSLPLDTYKPLGGDRCSQLTNYNGEKKIVVMNMKKRKQENKRKQGLNLREGGQERRCIHRRGYLKCDMKKSSLRWSRKTQTRQRKQLKQGQRGRTELDIFENRRKEIMVQSINRKKQKQYSLQAGEYRKWNRGRLILPMCKISSQIDKPGGKKEKKKNLKYLE